VSARTPVSLILISLRLKNIIGAESLRVEFDSQCSTERRHDPLTIMDGSGRVVIVRSGRDLTDWSTDIRISGK
jgi:E3 ubiquitin-protein ligase HERC2